jgi:glycosyltransferase involved in cell wall biosynthesis
MSNQPFFSIIIPTYNRSELVKTSIRLLKLQTFNNWECIIVNDGSTDNTKKIIEEHIKNEKRFILINQKNSERSIARNNGAKKATGDYLIFLDSDDYFESNHLDDLYKEILKDNSSHSMYFTNGKYSLNDSKKIILNEDVIYPIPIDYFLNNSVIPARVCLKKNLFDIYSFDPNAIIVEDTVLWTEILDKEKIKFIPITSVIYNIHDDNSVNIQKYNAYLKRLSGLKILFNQKPVGRKIDAKIKRKHVNRCFLGISEYYCFQNNKLCAIYWILKSIIYYPDLEVKHKLAKLLFLINFAKKDENV